MIHCIGDSHASFFSGKNEMQPIYPEYSDGQNKYFKSYRIGPATAYNLVSKIGIINHIIINNYNSNNNDYIMFIFGEVDCRLHLGIHNNIEECVERYFNVIKFYNDNNYNVLIYGVVASCPDYKTHESTPYFGTCLERNERTIKFNNLLKLKAYECGIKFISIFDEMLLEDGNTNGDFLHDHIHISQYAMPFVIEKLKIEQLIEI